MKSRQSAILASGVLMSALAVLFLRSNPEPATPGADESVSRQARPERPPNTAPTSRPAPGHAKTKSFQTLFQEVTGEKGAPKLTPAELESFLLSRNRNAESLLVAYRTTMDNTFLGEALKKFPDHPEVLLCALQLSTDPARRLEVLDAFKRNAPDNAIGNCLAARALLDLGKDEEGVAELKQSAGKPIEDFTKSSCQAMEEAYLHAGYPPLEAKAAALYGSAKPALLQMATPVLKKLDEIRQAYQASGDEAALQSLRVIQSGIGLELQQCGTIMDSIIGIHYEGNALKGMETPEAIAYREELEHRKSAMTGNSMKVFELQASTAVPESDWFLYLDRVKLFGEAAANDWLLEKHPRP